MDLSSPFLPDNLPDGDPVHYALPVFLDEPEDTFVVKNKDAELECRVAHAHSVYVQCQDEIQHGAVTEDHVDPETGIRITEARWRISRDQVEEYFGEYHCGCVAASGKGHVKSRLALVIVAFLKKTFETPPYSHQSLEGKQLELRCYPPRGKPDPEIHWLKNEQMVDESDSNYVVTHEGHLIIVNPRLSDSGNFTCVARNIAAERRSAPAEITIYGEFCDIRDSEQRHPGVTFTALSRNLSGYFSNLPGLYLVKKNDPRQPGAPHIPSLSLSFVSSGCECFPDPW